MRSEKKLHHFNLRFSQAIALEIIASKLSYLGCQLNTFFMQIAMMSVQEPSSQ